MNPLATTDRALLDSLLLRYQTTAHQLAQRLDLPASTVASSLSRLQAKGWIVRADQAPPSAPNPRKRPRGRPTLAYLPRLPGPIAAVLLDGSQIGGAILDAGGRCLAQHVMDAHRIDDRGQALRLVQELLVTLLLESRVRRDDLAYIALAPNAVRTSRGVLTSSVLPWASDNLVAHFAAAFGRPVHLVTRAPILAEYQFLPDPAPECLLSFSTGDGVSCHAVVFGQVSGGFNRLSGELGHVTVDPAGPPCGCGRRGCLETFCSGPAIVRAITNDPAARAAGPSGLTGGRRRSALDTQALAQCSGALAIEQVWRAWQARDPVARRVMDKVLDRLAWGLSLGVNLYDPDIVRVRGYVLHGREAWLDELKRRTRPLLIHGRKRTLNIEPGRADVPDVLRAIAYGALPQARLDQAAAV